MATKDVKKEEAVEAAPPPKSKKLLVIILGVAVLTLILGASVGFFIGHKKAPVSEAASSEASETRALKKNNDPKKPPVFVALEPFTVNLQPNGDSGEQFLQVVVSLRVADEKKGEELKAYMPQIRHEVLSLASSQKAAEITTQEGRENLAEDIKDTINEVLGYEPPRRSKRKKKEDDGAGENAPVIAVFFTQFIVQ